MKIDRRILMGFPAAVLVVVLAWYLLAWKPRLTAIANANSTLTSLQSQAANYEREFNQYKSGNTASQESAYESEETMLQAAIPPEVDLSGIINDFDNARLVSGVAFSSFSPSPPTAFSGGSATSSNSSGSALEMVGISVQLTGRYFQIVSFLDELQQLPRIYVVTSISLAGGNASSPASPSTLFTPNLTVTIAMSTFCTGASGSAIVSATTTTAAPGSSAAATATTVAPGVTNSTTSLPATGTVSP